MKVWLGRSLWQPSSVSPTTLRGREHKSYKMEQFGLRSSHFHCVFQLLFPLLLSELLHETFLPPSPLSQTASHTEAGLSSMLDAEKICDLL